jgi:PAS domain S-box-containing protein
MAKSQKSSAPGPDPKGATALLRRMADVASDGLMVTDLEGNVVEFNARLLEIWHFPPDWREQAGHELWVQLATQLETPNVFLSALREPAPAAEPARAVPLFFADGRRVEGGVQSYLLPDGTIGRIWRFRDLTAFWRGASDLEQEREWFRVTLSSIGDAVITTDTEAKITFLNPVAERMTGWSIADARGQPLTSVFNIINELTRAEAKNPVARVLAEGIVIGLANHTSLIDRHGHETAIEDSAAPIRDAGGKIVGTVMVFHDVDARRKAERALARSERLLADFFASAPVGLNWISPDGQVLRANRAELEILGCAENEYVGHSWPDFHVAPANAVALFEVLKAGGIVENWSGQLRRKDGVVREVLISANAFTENGRFVHARCFTRDVTEHNRAEAAQAHLAALVASSDDAIVSKNLDGIIRSWNEGAERLFGYTAAEAIGQPITLVIPPDRLEEEPAILERLK